MKAEGVIIAVFILFFRLMLIVSVARKELPTFCVGILRLSDTNWKTSTTMVTVTMFGFRRIKAAGYTYGCRRRGRT